MESSDGSVTYSDVPQGYTVKSSPTAPSYSDVPKGYTVKSSPVGDSPRSFGESLESRFGAGYDDLTNPLAGREPTPRPQKGETGAQYVMRVAKKDISEGIKAPLKMMGGIGKMLSSPAGSVGETIERKAGNMAGLSGPLLEKAARDTGDVTEMVPFFPAVKAIPKIATGTVNTGGKILGEAREVVNTVSDKMARGEFTKEVPKATQDLRNAAKTAGLDITGKTPDQINTQITDWFKGKTDKLTEGVSEGASKSEVWPLGKSFAISRNFDKEDKLITQSYSAARKLGVDQHVEATPVVEGLKGIIEDMEKKAAENVHIPEHASTLAQFKRLYAEIAEGKPSTGILDQYGQSLKTAIPNTLTANKLVEIKQALNKYYISAPDMTSADVPYSKLSGVVQNAIKNTSPAFQEAIKKANDAWSVFANTYKDNKIINQFWTPRDYDAFKAFSERSIPINSETQQRVYKMLDKIKTPADLEALKVSMKDFPKEYDSIRAAKFYEILDKTGLNAKAIDKNYDVIIKTLEGNPDAIQAVDAIKTLAEQLNQRGIGDLNPAAAAQRDSLISRNLRTVLRYTVGSKVAFGKKALGLMKDEPASAAQERLTNLKSEIGKPKP